MSQSCLVTTTMSERKIWQVFLCICVKVQYPKCPFAQFCLICVPTIISLNFIYDPPGKRMNVFGSLGGILTATSKLKPWDHSHPLRCISVRVRHLGKPRADLRCAGCRAFNAESAPDVCVKLVH